MLAGAIGHAGVETVELLLIALKEPPPDHNRFGRRR